MGTEHRQSHRPSLIFLKRDVPFSDVTGATRKFKKLTIRPAIRQKLKMIRIRIADHCSSYDSNTDHGSLKINDSNTDRGS